MDNLLEDIRAVLEKHAAGGVGEVKYLDALGFYANPANWKAGGTVFEPTPAPVAADMGELARRALGHKEPKGATPPPQKGGKGKKGKKKVATPRVQEEELEEGGDPRPTTRPESVEVTAKCRVCGKKVPDSPLLMVKTKMNEAGEMEDDFVCGRCIKERKVL